MVAAREPFSPQELAKQDARELRCSGLDCAKPWRVESETGRCYGCLLASVVAKQQAREDVNSALDRVTSALLESLSEEQFFRLLEGVAARQEADAEFVKRVALAVAL